MQEQAAQAAVVKPLNPRALLPSQGGADGPRAMCWPWRGSEILVN